MDNYCPSKYSCLVMNVQQRTQAQSGRQVRTGCGRSRCSSAGGNSGCCWRLGGAGCLCGGWCGSRRGSGSLCRRRCRAGRLCGSWSGRGRGGGWRGCGSWRWSWCWRRRRGSGRGSGRRRRAGSHGLRGGCSCCCCCPCCGRSASSCGCTCRGHCFPLLTSAGNCSRSESAWITSLGLQL